jgi:hypothetical protein
VKEDLPTDGLPKQARIVIVISNKVHFKLPKMKSPESDRISAELYQTFKKN